MKQLIRIGKICERLGTDHASTAYRLMKDDPDAPKPIRLGPKHVVYDADETDRWIERLAERGASRPQRATPSADDIRRGAATRKAKREAKAKQASLAEQAA